MSRVRVLHLINSLGGGGAERSLVELLPLIATRGVDSSVAVFSHPPEGVEAEVRGLGIELETIRGRGIPLQVAALRRRLTEYEPNVLHTTLFDADIVGRLAAARTDLVVASSLVNMTYSTDRANDPNITPWKLNVTRRIDGWTARHLCNGFHSITDAVAVASIRDLKIAPDRLVVIPRGRNQARLGERSACRRSEVRARLGLPDNQPVVLNVGRHEFQKDQATLLRAIQILRVDVPDIHLLIAGREGNATAELRGHVRGSALEECVTLLGFTDEVPDLLAAADVFAFPSRFEGLGGSVLEAMALEVPIVATDIPALREVLGGGTRGALVPVADPEQLAAGLSLALDGGPDVVDRVVAARAAFESEFELDRVADRMAEWFHTLASQGRL